MFRVFLYLAFSAATLTAWYWCSRQSKRNRAVQVMHWLERALAGAGHVAGIRWLGVSEFEVPVRMSSRTFRDVKVTVRLKRNELPLTWLMSRLRKAEPETLTFVADLDLKPNFSLDLRNMRWFARSRQDLTPTHPGWQFENAEPVVLTTRTEWQREITQVMHSVVNCENREMVDVRFSRRSPHFRATMPLECISPAHFGETRIFNTLRDIATGTSSTAA